MFLYIICLNHEYTCIKHVLDWHADFAPDIKEEIKGIVHLKM